MRIFLTLDYELYLGHSTGTPSNCLIRPMEFLCRIMKKYDAKLVIFADASYLLKLEELKQKFSVLQKEYEMVSKHLRLLSNAGHDIELHVHPQWLYAQWNGEKWLLDFKHYKLSDLPEELARSYFRETKKCLEAVISKPVQAFRAGGYSIQTFPNYAQLFRENNIVIDSSVRKGAKVNSKFQNYDFTHIPSDSLYRFDDKIEIASEKGLLWELPISTLKKHSYTYLSMKRHLVKEGVLQGCFGDGEGIGRSGSQIQQLAGMIKKVFMPQVVPAALDGVQLPIGYHNFIFT